MKERSLPISIILCFLTCGLYTIYWIYAITEDMAQLTDDRDLSGAKTLLLMLVTCGLYGFYWYYKMGKQVALLRSDAEDQSVLYLILSILSLGIISMLLMQDEINKALRDRRDLEPFEY